MKLVIAEKPSVARSIAAVLGATNSCAGYLDGNGYLVSWCFGHLAVLADADYYDIRYKKWVKEDLPIVPPSFRFRVPDDKRSQFDLLKDLMRQQDVSEVINACDAGREGELIFRTVYYLAGCAKPMKRLWISSMEDDAIRDGFANLRPGREFDALHQSALCRAKADWLVGINATRYFSLVYGTKLNVGRVMSPTLAMMVQREADISAFVPERYYTVNLDCGFIASSERVKAVGEATRIAESSKGTVAVIKSVERVEKAENPPMLYDLTTLQRDANRLLGYTAQQTLDYLQSLYEKKLCTYPRTDSRFLSDDMLPGVGELTRGAASILGVLSTEVNAQRVCNSKKVTDHHAIIPTRFAISADLAALPAAEQEILKLVCKGLLKATAEPYKYAETVVKLDCAGTEFTAKGKTVLVSGWKAYEKAEEKQTILPDLREGQSVKVSSVSVKEGQTAPPKHYTEDTLLSSMETAGAGEIPEDAERKGLGTPATRACIIEKLVASGLIERKTAKKLTSLHPSSQGVSLITVLPEQLQSPQLTAEWEQELLAIQNGEQDSETFMEGICAMLQDLFQEYTPVDGASILFPSNRETVGKCPRCGYAVKESKKGYFCSNHDCHFAIWKNNRFFTAKKKNVAPELVAELLTKGEVILKGCFSERTGKYYDAKVAMEDDGHTTNFRMVFDND